ncbi:MAG TPA: PilN domain-containing protein [Patescibacteria group bacterium]|nr:PilN domain-containing protein [Patescibacteria group bacterium]
MAKNKSVNLLPQEEFDTSVLGRTLKWAMGSFRIIVILTEMIVMAAFLSRFWLDAQNSDLSQSIKNASAQIQAQSNFEKEFRGVQQKLNIFKQIASAKPASGKVELIASKTPTDLTLSSISVQENLAQIKGTSTSEIGITQFISNLEAEPTFKKVELGSVGSSEQNQTLITFFISVTF